MDLHPLHEISVAHRIGALHLLERSILLANLVVDPPIGNAELAEVVSHQITMM